MGRPAKDSEGPNAVERMEDAFWECLRKTPFEKITVRDIVERAGVNRNSYYYHFGGMWDLAESSVHDTMMLEFAHMLLDERLTAKQLMDGISSMRDAPARFGKLRLLAGPNGNQRLLGIARDAIVGEWLRMYGIAEADLNESTMAIIEFVFGGVAALWASNQFADVERLVHAVTHSGLVAHNLEALRQELAAIQREAERQGKPTAPTPAPA